MNSRVGCALLVLGLLLLTYGPVAAEDQPGRDQDEALESLKKVVAGDAGGRARSDAAAEIAKHFFDPERLAPWLRKRLAEEQDFHVRLALAYALAAQGEKEGLQVLVDALQRTGHLGYVYLTRVSAQDFGGPGVGWNVPAWTKWLTNLDETAFRALQQNRHKPRGPKDGDRAGLEQAIAWWDGLGLPNVGKKAFVRVYDGWMETGGERVDRYTYGFLLKKRSKDFTVLGTDLRERRYLRKRGKQKATGRFEKVNIRKAVTAELKRFQADMATRLGDRSGGPEDPFGVDYFLSPRRRQGFVLACALYKRGAKDLAEGVWKHTAASSRGASRYGQWSAVELVKQDVAAGLLEAWEGESLAPKVTWGASLKAFRSWAKRFGTAQRDYTAATTAILERMAAEESGYAAAAKGGAGPVGEQAVRLVLALPTTGGTGHLSGGRAWEADKAAKNAFTRLVALGSAAVPALIPALADQRFTKSVRWHHGHKGYIRSTRVVLRVGDLALSALNQIARRDFSAGADDAAAVRKAAEAWWQLLQTKGESGVLIEGVERADASSPAQAELLIEKFPDQAFEPIREAFESADDRVASKLLATLGGLRTSAVRKYLLEQAEDGEMADRMAAALALHEQDDGRGVEALLKAWPAEAMHSRSGPGGMDLGREPVRGLAVLLLRLEPILALEQMHKTLADTPPPLKYEIVNQIHAALGYALFYQPGEEPDLPRSAKERDAVEAFLVHLVLDKGRREGKVFAFGPGEPGGRQTNLVGSAAAKKLAYVWPKRYTFDESQGLNERLEQRYAIVNAWRKAHGKPTLALPKRFAIKPLPAATVKPLLRTWQAAAEGSAREEATAAIVALGLGALPALRTLRDGEKDAGAKAQLDALVRRMARIVRVVRWREASPKPSAALAALVAALEGQPIRGRDLTNLLRECFVAPTPGTTGIEFTLSRAGDGTGYVMDVAMTTHRVPWQGGAGGYILSGDGGRQLVDAFLEDRDSWWHKSRSSQFDKVLDGPDTQEVRFSRSFAKVK